MREKERERERRTLPIVDGVVHSEARACDGLVRLELKLHFVGGGDHGVGIDVPTVYPHQTGAVLSVIHLVSNIAQPLFHYFKRIHVNDQINFSPNDLEFHQLYYTFQCLDITNNLTLL